MLPDLGYPLNTDQALADQLVQSFAGDRLIVLRKQNYRLRRIIAYSCNNFFLLRQAN